MEDDKKYELHAVKLLKSARLRVTVSRTDILAFLLKTGRPVSHAEVQEALPSMDRVTLYRALASFVSSEAAHQVQGPDGAWRFCAHELNSGECPGNHPHFMCVSCGKMLCLPDQKLPRVEVPEDYQVAGKQLVLYGKCGVCAKS